MVYYDQIGHLIADTENELHNFAFTIGLKREWYQDKGKLSHYDLTTERMKNKAQRYGAIKIDPRELVRKLISK